MKLIRLILLCTQFANYVIGMNIKVIPLYIQPIADNPQQSPRSLVLHIEKQTTIKELKKKSPQH